jgi:hypothetical protein
MTDASLICLAHLFARAKEDECPVSGESTGSYIGSISDSGGRPSPRRKAMAARIISLTAAAVFHLPGAVFTFRGTRQERQRESDVCPAEA